NLRAYRYHSGSIANRLQGRDLPHLPALATLPVALYLRQHHDWQSQAAEPGALVQFDAPLRIQEAVRAKLPGSPDSARCLRAQTLRSYVRARRWLADDRPAAHRDLPRADQRA